MIHVEKLNDGCHRCECAGPAEDLFWELVVATDTYITINVNPERISTFMKSLESAVVAYEQNRKLVDLTKIHGILGGDHD